MTWYGHDASGWGWFAMSVSMVLFWVLLITAAVLVIRAMSHSGEHTHPPATPTAEQLLAERFARGDIDENEYRSRLAALHSPGPSTRP